MGTVLAPPGSVAATSDSQATALRLSIADPFGHAPPIPVGATDLGRAPAGRPLAFDVVLNPRDPASLQALAIAVSTRGTAQFRHFLTTTQFAERFGAAPSTVRTVENVLHAVGLATGPISANDLVIPIKTSIGQAEQSLHTGFNEYRLSSGRVALANTKAPELPAVIASDVQSVIGLNTLATVNPKPPIAQRTAPAATGSSQVSATSGPSPCTAAVTAAKANGAWTYNQLAKAYSFTSLYQNGQLGANTTVALFEQDPYSASDIATFQACYGTSAVVTNINVDGGDGTGAGSGEADLDIDTVIGLAPEAHILTYEAPESNYALSTVDEYTAIVTQDQAQIVSSSYGDCESDLNAFASGLVESESTLFQEAATAGISLFAAAGDDGSSDCYPNGGFDAVSVGTKPVAVAVDPSFHTAYVADKGDGTIDVVDDQNQDLVTSIQLGAGSEPQSITVDPKSHKVFATLAGIGALVEFSSATCSAVTTTDCSTKERTLSTLASDLEGVAANPATRTVYVALWKQDAVAAVKESGLSLIAQISSNGSEPYGVGIDSSNNTVYVTNFGSQTVAQINGATCDAASSSGCDQNPPTTVVGSEPASAVADNAVGQVFVVNYGGNDLSVLSATTGALLGTVGLDSLVSDPVDVVLSPDGHHLLIPSDGTGPNSVQPGIVQVSINTNSANDKVTGMLDDAGNQPWAAASDPTNDVVAEADPSDQAAVLLPLEPAVDDPGSQQFVTSVGGTDLTKLGPKPTETTWNETFDSSCGCQNGAGGGGISTNWPMPTWQTGPGVVSSLSSGIPCAAATGLCREVPDVSAAADWVHGYMAFEDGVWYADGGTSAAAPLWAALLSVIESKNATPVRLGFVNPQLYAAAASDGSSVFNDITKGTNDYAGLRHGLFPSTAGYDMASGLGTPVAPGVQSALSG
jgi:DNA-binding beta-propeller fold protein YncE